MVPKLGKHFLLKRLKSTSHKAHACGGSNIHLFRQFTLGGERIWQWGLLGVGPVFMTISYTSHEPLLISKIQSFNSIFENQKYGWSDRYLTLLVWACSSLANHQNRHSRLRSSSLRRIWRNRAERLWGRECKTDWCIKQWFIIDWRLTDDLPAQYRWRSS